MFTKHTLPLLCISIELKGGDRAYEHIFKSTYQQHTCETTGMREESSFLQNSFFLMYLGFHLFNMREVWIYRT